MFLFRLFGLFRETGGLQLFDGGDGIGGKALAAGLESLDAYEVSSLYLLGITETVVPAEGHLDAGISLVGEQDKTGVDVLREPVLLALRGFHQETLQVGIALLVGIVENGRPYLV